MVQRAALVRYFKADADFLCILLKNLLVRYDDEPG